MDSRIVRWRGETKTNMFRYFVQKFNEILQDNFTWLILGKVNNFPQQEYEFKQKIALVVLHKYDCYIELFAAMNIAMKKKFQK